MSGKPRLNSTIFAMKDILIGLLSKAYNLDNESAAALLYKKADDGTLTEEQAESALDEILKLDASRVQSLKGDTKKFFDNGYQKAQKDVSERWEKMIREKAGIQSDATGEDLIAALLESKPGKKMNADEIKTHPEYLSLEQKYLKEVKEAKESAAAEIQQFQKQYQAQAVREAAKAKAKELLLSKKPVVEEDADIANTRIGDFLREFDSFEFETVEGGFLPVKEGKRLENDHGHPIEFGQLVDQIAGRRFKFQVQDPKGSSGNKNEPGGGGGTPTNYKFASKQDFETRYYAEQDRAKRSEMAKQYQEQAGA